ncbi:MAG: sugar phosphate isomerase/epimerase [Planctomycetota bacterium]|nr:sugar phosphate isomerase/epimerase [Planctomycetota bacterium]
MNRRDALRMAAMTAAALMHRTAGASVARSFEVKDSDSTVFSISLAQWSLHREYFGLKIDPLDFPVITRTTFGLGGVEYVNSFYKHRIAKGAELASELRRRCDDHGVTSVLIMCDGEGELGAADSSARGVTVENHVKWLELAKALGCHSIRVNAQSTGTFDEQQKLAADGLRLLCERATPLGLNVIVENHGGLSSNGAWLAGVMRLVNLPNCGTLPDFGNFGDYDCYKGVEELMPFAKGVSAKSHDFSSPSGIETKIDFARMLSIIRATQFKGWIGIEYEGSRLSEMDGILATKALLESLGCSGKKETTGK